MVNKISNLNIITMWIVLFISAAAIVSYISEVKECEKDIIKLNIVLDEGVWDIPREDYQRIINEQMFGKTTLNPDTGDKTWLKD